MKDKEQASNRTQKILEGLEKAYQQLVEFKRYKRTLLVVAKDGIIIEIPPTTSYKRNVAHIKKDTE